MAVRFSKIPLQRLLHIVCTICMYLACRFLRKKSNSSGHCPCAFAPGPFHFSAFPLFAIIADGRLAPSRSTCPIEKDSRAGKVERSRSY